MQARAVLASGTFIATNYVERSLAHQSLIQKRKHPLECSPSGMPFAIDPMAADLRRVDRQPRTSTAMSWCRR